MDVPTRAQMYGYYFDDPREKIFQKEVNCVKVKYFYLEAPITVQTGAKEVCNFCLLKGSSTLRRNEEEFNLNQFDMGFLPKSEQVIITPFSQNPFDNKICIVTSPILEKPSKKIQAEFEIQRFSLEKFIPRGELGDTQKMATYREVWTAFNNSYFISGFTNIPQQALTQGVLTSVNLEKDSKSIKILSHIHPGYPEIYIHCIDDPTESVAITQYLINAKGQSVAKDLTDGEGIFFDGSLGHMNFIKPTYRKLNYCLYMWIIATLGKTQYKPITLNLEPF